MGSPLSKYLKCTRKKSYETQRKANKAIEKLMVQKDAYGVELLASYECPFCHCWHFGHKKKGTQP